MLNILQYFFHILEKIQICIVRLSVERENDTFNPSPSQLHHCLSVFVFIAEHLKNSTQYTSTQIMST